MPSITAARRFAKKKHAGQFRKNGKTTTFSHLEDVVKNLKRMKIKNEEIICAGWLHDTIEDTDTDFDTIEERFGKEVAKIVVSVTKDNRLPKKKRERKYVRDLKASSSKAKLVKIADIVVSVTKDNRLPKKQRELKYARDLKTANTKAKLVKIADILANVNDAPNAERNLLWEKQQFIKKSKYWSYVSDVKPGRFAKLSWVKTEWNRLQEKYSD